MFRLGAATRYIPDLNNKARLQELLGTTPLGTFQKFKRIKIGEQVFHSRAYSRAKKRNSYTVVYEEETGQFEAYGQIQFFLQHRPPTQHYNQSNDEAAAFAVIWKLEQDGVPFQDVESDIVANHIEAVSYPG
jgi:hypothetical protein